MAESIISPGVFTRENDQSFLTALPIQAGAAIVGPAVKGPVETPTVVTSYSEYKNKFGGSFTSGSNSYTYFTTIAAHNYFQNGGDTLLVTRVTNGAYTSATANILSGSDDADVAFKLKTIAKGINQNSTSSQDNNGALESGSADNVRWEIVNRDTGSGTFTLLIRRGNDLTDDKVILETYANVSLDPYSDNYLPKVVGDQRQTLLSDSDGNYFLQITGSYPNLSNYVYVESVDMATPNYFDNSGNFKSEFTASLPLIGSGTFKDATGDIAAGAAFYEEITNDSNIQGLSANDYDKAINLLGNRDAYVYNSLIVPGVIEELGSDAASVISNMIATSQERGDFISVVDLVKYGTINTSAVTAKADGFNTSYAATYWPWCQVRDPELGRNVWVPASTLIPGVFAFNDNTAEPWFAPAGLNRGALSEVIRTERILTKTDRDNLYGSRVNPIATFPNAGVVVFGQKTLQKKASALDRVNVRRLLIQLKGFIGQLAQNLVFEQNSIATRNSFLSQVNPYLETVQQRQGLYAFRVVMDDSNNTPDVVDRNQLVGQIFLQPTKTAEFIVLDFNVLPTGAEFPS